jgi:glycosyltransferase involved in cell wall biosynthesis
MRPKVLLFFEYGTLNGGEFSLLAMLEMLRQTEFEFVAAAPQSGMLTGRLEQLGMRVLPLTLRDTQGHKQSIELINAHLLELIAQVSPDLVHANSLSMGRMLGRIAPQLSIPCTAHLRDIIKLTKTAVSDLNQNAGLIAVSRATKQFHHEQGMLSDKLQVIYNGVNRDVFHPRSATGVLKQELGLCADTILLGNIGQICLRKGQTLLAQAAVSLAEEFPEANYLFIGERHSQKQESIAYENTIRTTFGDAGIEDRLFRLGFRQGIPELLSEIDLLVHTAHQEPLGRVLLEAASCAKAIVATDVGGTSEILTDQVSALLVRPNDLKALTAAISRMLTDHALRIRLGQQARADVSKRFALPTASARMCMFWKSFM